MPDISKLLQDTLQRAHNIALNDKPLSANKDNKVGAHGSSPFESGQIDAKVIATPTPDSKDQPTLVPTVDKYPNCSDRTPADAEDYCLSIPPLSRVLIKNAASLCSGINDRIEITYVERSDECLIEMYPLLEKSLVPIIQAFHDAVQQAKREFTDARPERQCAEAGKAMIDRLGRIDRGQFKGAEIHKVDLNTVLLDSVIDGLTCAIEQVQRDGQPVWEQPRNASQYVY